MRRSVPVVVAAALVLTLAGGCASVRAKRARAGALRAELDAYRHPKPLAEVWLEVRRLMYEGRYGMKGKDLEALGVAAPGGVVVDLFSRARETGPAAGGGLVMETEFGPGEGTSRRYRVEGSEGPEGTRVVITVIPEDPSAHRHDGPGQGRDLELELLLVRRLDPAAADRIEHATAERLAPGTREGTN